MADFVTPSFLQNCSVDDWYEKMKAIMPSDIDLSEGNHAFNMTRPTALVAAELCEFILPEVIKLVFPSWSYGEFLDGHSKARSITRKAATAATGEITITGPKDTLIPEGSLFATASINDEPSVDYRTTEAATIPESGSVTVPIICTKTGTVGNTTAGTIILVGSKITGITSVTNAEDVTGGTEEETDELLIERIEDYDSTQGESFVGCPADYKRWATSVSGVGDATIVSAQDDSGLVRIVLTDQNGAPATPYLCEAVYNYIMKPEDPGTRLAPVNAFLSVEPPATIEIGVRATVELKDGSSLEAVKADFLRRIALYLPVALDEGEVKHTRVAAVMAATEGANDFSDLEIGIKNGDSITWGTSNIPVTTIQLPAVSEENLVLTTGTV